MTLQLQRRGDDLLLRWFRDGKEVTFQYVTLGDGDMSTTILLAADGTPTYAAQLVHPGDVAVRADAERS